MAFFVERHQLSLYLNIGLLCLFCVNGRSLYCQESFATTSEEQGLFESFNDFRDGTMKNGNEIYFEKKQRKGKHWKDTYKIIPRYKKNDKKVKKIWGYKFDHLSYIAFAGDYFELKKSSKFYHFIGPYSDNYNYYGNYGAIGGLVGAVLSEAFANDKKKEYIVSPFTGKIYLTEEHFEENEKLFLVVFRKNKKEIETPITVSIADSLNYSFQPDSYTELTFEPTVPIIKVKYGSDLENEKVLEYGLHQKMYLELSFSNENEEIVLTQLLPSEGKFRANRLKKKFDKSKLDFLPKKLRTEGK